ncbi:MAG: hypothetical protein LBR97_00155 [Dysgonamonadaceae bacterium]|jgi:hypothetical protein|nr:hypothetical protein [Dysgonamonadaceae bacterium]
MKMTKKTIFLLSLFLMVLGTVNVNAQVRIGGDIPPNASAVLDLNPDNVSDASGGLLLPRVSLTTVDDPDPFLSHERGLVVYNLTTGNDLKEGIYYNDGLRWHPVLSSEPVGGLDFPIIFLRQPGKVWLGDTGSLIDTMYVELFEKTPTTTFQWYKRDPGTPPVLLAGETSDTLFINSNKFDLLGLTALGKVSQFFCLVRNGSQTAISGSGYVVFGPGAWLANGKWINIAPANLGATENNLADQLNHIPSNAYDKTVYGDLYQWGRKKDGHEDRTKQAADAELFYKDSEFGVPVDSLDVNGQIEYSKTGYGKFIMHAQGTYDWRDYPTDDSDNTIISPSDKWTWANPVNDPCKAELGDAWHVPSSSEWVQIHQNNTWRWYMDGTSGYEIKPGGAARPTSFFLPAAGYRNRSNGEAVFTANGYYRSSDVVSNTQQAYNLDFTSGSITPMSVASRSGGSSVRCVSEY